MSSSQKNTLLVVLGIVIAFLVWRNYNGRVRLSSFKNELSKFHIEKQFFKETITKDSLKLAEQSQVILSQKDAIRLGVLEIDKLKKVKSQVRTVTKIKVDSFFVEFHDTLLLKDTIYPKGFLAVPKRFKYAEQYFNFDGIVLTDKLLVDSFKLHNEMKLTIANKRNGFFNKSTPVVQLENSNPYINTLDMNNVVIKKDKKFFDRKVFWVGVGILGTYIIVK
jgi:hypothetical protein